MESTWPIRDMPNPGRCAPLALRVDISNVDQQILYWCNDRFLGSVCRVESTPKSKLTWRWIVSYRAAENVLRGCLPCLKIKRRQAEICLKFAETGGAEGRWLLKHKLQAERKPWEYKELEKELGKNGCPEEYAFRVAAKVIDERRKRKSRKGKAESSLLTGSDWHRFLVEVQQKAQHSNPVP